MHQIKSRNQREVSPIFLLDARKETFCTRGGQVPFSDSDSTPVPKFLNPSPDPRPEYFQIWESDTCSDSVYNHRSNRNLPTIWLRNDHTDLCATRNEKWPQIRVRFFTNFWLRYHTQVRRKNSESSWSRLRHSRSGPTSHLYTPVVCKIRILESIPAGYLDIFGFGLDIVSLSTGLSKGNKLRPCKKSWYGIIVVLAKITIFRNHNTKTGW